MMAFNNGYPVSYQQMYQPFTSYQPTVQPAPQQTQTKMVEVFPVENLDSAVSYPVPVGSTYVFFARDDSFIAVKSSGINGQSSFDVYDKRPPEPPAPTFDPSAYVRRDEIDGLVSSMISEYNKRNKEE